jgi:hypothetical protein
MIDQTDYTNVRSLGPVLITGAPMHAILRSDCIRRTYSRRVALCQANLLSLAEDFTVVDATSLHVFQHRPGPPCAASSENEDLSQTLQTMFKSHITYSSYSTNPLSSIFSILR